ncbi:MAG: type II toxin-antitoxin system YafQ family toxin [Alloprevotella sp.]|nr:type II toxin-antitoxin system YafQ family toxin [Alloprevotella sp.]MBR1653161.1 type II toxin-antitoxin system YafQ family toxin [Alloprevotella sp.]
MAYKISTTHQFEKDLKRCIKRGYPMGEFRTVIQLLERDGRLPEVYRAHMLHGDRQGQWECHIQPDWLLIWKQVGNELELLMLNTGTHSDLFSKKYKKK